jgi:hypothetical protein
VLPDNDKEPDDVQAILNYTRELERRARGLDGGTELLVEAVLLCAGKIQDMTVSESAHSCAARRIVSESDLGSHDTLRRIRGVLRAAAQVDRVRRDLHPAEEPSPR